MPSSILFFDKTHICASLPSDHPGTVGGQCAQAWLYPRECHHVWATMCVSTGGPGSPGLSGVGTMVTMCGGIRHPRPLTRSLCPRSLSHLECPGSHCYSVGQPGLSWEGIHRLGQQDRGAQGKGLPQGSPPPLHTPCTHPAHRANQKSATGDQSETSPFKNPLFECGAVHRTNQRTFFSMLHLCVVTANWRALFLTFLYVQQKAKGVFFHRQLYLTLL